MSADSEAASEQARFGARAFVVQWQRETCEDLTPIIKDRMAFAYEVGYLRGRSDAAMEALKMFDEADQAARVRAKGSQDESTIETTDGNCNERDGDTE